MRTSFALLIIMLAACGSTSSSDAGLDVAENDVGGDTSEPDAGSDGGDDTGPADAAVDAFDAGRDAGPLECGGETSETIARCVDEARYVSDLTFIAQPRAPGSAHWTAVQDLCATRLMELGFDVERHNYGTGVNVIGVKTGTTLPDERVLIAAHYDSTAGCPGADDNATGTAGVLEAARVLSAYEHERTLVVACWDEEERGLVGSNAYATREADAGRSFVVNFNFEMIGYYDDEPNSQMLPTGFDLLFPAEAARIAANMNRGDFIALIGDFDSAPFVERLAFHAEGLGLRSEALVIAEGLHTSPLLADLRRSDHDSFWQTNVPAIMITDTSEFRYDAYHCSGSQDTIERLDTTFATQVTAATAGAAADALAE